MITGLPIPFAEVSYADEILVVDPWLNATEAQKESALQYARMYIEETYSCLFDLTDAPETVQTANVFLAQEHLTSDIFARGHSDQPARGLTESSVEAKGVKVSKKWDSERANKWRDPFPSITALLSQNGWCSIKKGGGIRVVHLIRA